MAVEPEGGVGQVLGKRLAIISFAQQHVAELASCVQFVNAPRRIAAVINKHEQHFAFLAVVRTVEPRLRRIRLGARAFSARHRHHFLLWLHFVRGIEVINSRARFADHNLLAIPHFVVGLRPQHHLAAHALVVEHFRQSIAAELRHPLIVTKNIFGNPVPERVALGVPLGKLFLILGGNFARFFFFLFDFGRLCLELGFGRFDFFFACLDVDHHLQDAVLVEANLLLRKLDLVQNGFVLFVGFYVERLVAILGNLALQVFYVGFELLAVGFVALGRGSRLFQVRLGPSQLLLDHRHAFRQRGDFVPQSADLFIRRLQFQQFVDVRKHRFGASHYRF